MTEKRYGDGYIKQKRGRYQALLPNGKGGHNVVATRDTPEEAELMRVAALIELGRVGLKTTLRQWGPVFLEAIKGHRSIVSATNTWNSVILRAPFVDDPMEDLTTPQLHEYASSVLPQSPKLRSVIVNGKRTRVETGKPISRKYAQNALIIFKKALELAHKKGILESNPAESIVVESDRFAVPEQISYLSAEEIELLLSCADCAPPGQAPISDIDLLITCPHMPIEKRVAFTLAIHQCPRAGELAAMEWDRVHLDAGYWMISKSWTRKADLDGPTKSKRMRPQALLPRAIRALRVWHALKGWPTSGYVFVSPRTGGGKPARYAAGYDWGWADTPSNGKQGLRLGWPRRVGITTRVRFHDTRDTAATHLLSGTWGPVWPIKQVSEHLGHSATHVTEARYAHLTMQAKITLAQATESAQHTGHSRVSWILDNTVKLSESLAPEAGLEPTTNRLTAHSTANNLANLQPSDPCVARVWPVSVRAQAAQLLCETQRGRFPVQLAVMLAKAVTRDRVFALATQVLDMDHHVVERSIELAGVLADADALTRVDGPIVPRPATVAR